MFKQRRIWFLLINIGILFLILFIGPFLIPYSPTDINPDAIWLSPCKAHLLGTDSTGRDVLARVLCGGRNSIMLALISELFALPIGVVLGYIGAIKSGMLVWILDHLMDIMFSFPTIVLALLFAGIFGAGWFTILGIIIIVEIPVYYIYTKRQVKHIKEELFIQVLEEMGMKKSKIFTRHITIHLIPLLMPKIIFNFATTIIFESSLSFIGIGIQPPTPSWGNLISAGIPFIKVHPTLLISTSLLFAITTLLLFGLADSWRKESVQER